MAETSSSAIVDEVTNIGILSIGEMGGGIAKLLLAHGYKVCTSTTGRRCVTFSASI